MDTLPVALADRPITALDRSGTGPQGSSVRRHGADTRDAMRELWTRTEEPDALRVVAMTAIGALRLALNDWRSQEAQYPLADRLSRYFGLHRYQY